MVAKTEKLIITVHTQMIDCTWCYAYPEFGSPAHGYVWLLVFLLHSTLWPSRPLLREASVVQTQLNLPLQMRSGVIVHVTTRDKTLTPASRSILRLLYLTWLFPREENFWILKECEVAHTVLGATQHGALPTKAVHVLVSLQWEPVRAGV